MSDAYEGGTPEGRAAIRDGVRRFVRDRLLLLIPYDADAAMTVTTIAARADMAVGLAQAKVGELVNAGDVAELHTKPRRYHRNTPEEKVKQRAKVKAPLSARILAELPADLPDEVEAENGPTVLELGAVLSCKPKTVWGELRELEDAGQVVRRGDGKRGDPFRHYAAVDDQGAGVADELDAGDDGDKASEDLESPPAAETPEIEATQRPVSRDRAPADTVGPPETEAAPLRGKSPLQSVADLFDPPAGPGGYLRTAYQRVAQDLRLRAREARQEADILGAAAELAERIQAELKGGAR